RDHADVRLPGQLIGLRVVAQMTVDVVPRTTAEATLRGVLAALSVAAAVIHFAVVFPHFAEDWRFGAFFLVLGWAQVAWVVFAGWRPSTAVLWTGVAGNLAVL